MEHDKVKNVFQQAFDRFKEQFDEFITGEKRKEFNKLFKVKVDVYGNVYVDNISAGINCKDCGESFSYIVDVERIYIIINLYKILIIEMDWEPNQETPNIKNIALEISIYSSGNQ